MKYKHLIMSIVCSMIMGSCDFLNTVPQDFVAPENFFKNKEEAFMSLTAVYNRLTREQVYGNA